MESEFGDVAKETCSKSDFSFAVTQYDAMGQVTTTKNSLALMRGLVQNIRNPHTGENIGSVVYGESFLQ